MAARRKDREQGIYRRVSVRMWGDAKVRALTAPPPGGLVLWFHLLTGEQTGIIPGLHKIGEAAFAEQLGWPLEGFREAFREVEAQGMARADWAARVIWVPKAIEHNVPASPNAVRAWADAWDLMPECSLKVEAWRALRAFLQAFSEAYAEAFDEACPKPSVKTSGNQEQEQEQEKSSLPRAGASARDEGHSLDPEAEQHSTAARHETASGPTHHPVETAEKPRDPADAPVLPGPHAAAGDESPGPGDAPAESDPAKANAGSGDGAAPQRPDGGEAPGAADRRDTASGGRGAPTRLPHGLDGACRIEYPRTARLMDALAVLGVTAAWASKSETRNLVEDAIVEQDVAVVAARIADAVRETPWLGHHVALIRAPRRAPRSGIGDLGSELIPWNQRLSPEDHRTATAELQALAILDPDLECAPLGIPGNPDSPAYEAIRELNAKWRAVAEARRP